MAIYTRDGQTWETRNLNYGYYEGSPCKIVELRGDFESYRAPDSVLLQAHELSDGWVRYITTSNEPEERASLAGMAAASLTH